MKIDPWKQQSLLASLRELTEWLEQAEVQKSCRSCEYWGKGGAPGCGQWNVTPPEDVQREGCEAWLLSEVPF